MKAVHTMDLLALAYEGLSALWDEFAGLFPLLGEILQALYG